MNKKEFERMFVINKELDENKLKTERVLYSPKKVKKILTNKSESNNTFIYKVVIFVYLIYLLAEIIKKIDI